MTDLEFRKRDVTMSYAKLIGMFFCTISIVGSFVWGVAWGVSEIKNSFKEIITKQAWQGNRIAKYDSSLNVIKINFDVHEKDDDHFREVLIASMPEKQRRLLTEIENQNP